MQRIAEIPAVKDLQEKIAAGHHTFVGISISDIEGILLYFLEHVAKIKILKIQRLQNTYLEFVY